MDIPEDILEAASRGYSNQYGLIKWDGYDDAIVGCSLVKRESGLHWCLVYNYDKLIEIAHGKIKQDTGEECWDDAEEYIQYNLIGAYVGPQTPITVYAWT